MNCREKVLVDRIACCKCTACPLLGDMMLASASSLLELLRFWNFVTFSDRVFQWFHVSQIDISLFRNSPKITLIQPDCSPCELREQVMYNTMNNLSISQQNLNYIQWLFWQKIAILKKNWLKDSETKFGINWQIWWTAC